LKDVRHLVIDVTNQNEEIMSDYCEPKVHYFKQKNKKKEISKNSLDPVPYLR